MQYNTLIQNIQADIYSNGAELITGDILQSVLLQMVGAWASAGAMYGGVITPDSAAPADLNQATAYLALEAGTYTNFVDGGGNPIVTAGPALITYDGGASLVFAKTDLPSGGSGATVITNDGTDGDAVAIRLTDNHSYKRSFRIDMTAEYTGGANEQRIGSLIIECYSDATDDICHGYYYGDDMSDILSEVAVYQDDIDPDTFYLMLTHESSLDSVIFAISPTDGGEVDAFITNAADDHTKVDDANISPVGSGGGDGKMGVISQTQTWSGTGSNPRTYVMSNQVWGAIPQANIDLFEAAGATFNTLTGYFELNGLTDISYEEMKEIYNGSITMLTPIRTRSYTLSDIAIRTNLPMVHPTSTVTVACDGLCLFSHQIEAVNVGTLNSQNNMQDAFRGNSIRKIIGEMKVGSVTEANFNRTFNNAYSLEEVTLYNVKVSIPIKDSSLLSLASVVYMVENAANTSAITITLHATAYARCQADTTEYTYQGNTYTGIIALATAKNITIASA